MGWRPQLPLLLLVPTRQEAALCLRCSEYTLTVLVLLVYQIAEQDFFYLQRNIVATVNLDCRLDLKTIALHARNAEYNPKVLLSTSS
ncbi:uncharacterized protein BO95DRAFT_438473 [Aspergillus brunneoviolaceus CBS 621.78]|uniref:Uncharacterized protein n=1 Tax=Aspergillus brunneoviolaceus CBS 621.78 TaxID=1450534 RepID=A0ACD1GN69_9EURO|nr:hypothetical protein BO95DRAFT_438473 [Aspergillus brunneoviolaceus CBS 621.78]RAH50711.1 hypothetical protein BO95DRAFT_438473 [Aspergillus brunneoviolaceus CBS 621.78]